MELSTMVSLTSVVSSSSVWEKEELLTPKLVDHRAYFTLRFDNISENYYLNKK